MNADAKLSRIRYLLRGNLTQNGYIELSDAFRELDAHLSAGGTPPEAWREGPDAPAESNDPYCAAHGRRFDPAIGCVDCISDMPTTDTQR